MPFELDHGDISALGFRIGKLAYTPDVKRIPEASRPLLEGLDVWIIDALRYRPHPSHFSLDEALAWIEAMRPKRAILTNMHTDLDYETLRSRLPEHIVPAYDGMRIEGFDELAGRRPLIRRLSTDAPVARTAPPTGRSFDKLRMRFAWQPDLAAGEDMSAETAIHEYLAPVRTPRPASSPRSSRSRRTTRRATATRQPRRSPSCSRGSVLSSSGTRSRMRWSRPTA